MGGQPNSGVLDPIVLQLLAIRVAEGMSQKALAEAMGTTQSAVSESERAITQPTLQTLRRWAEALGYDLVLVKRKGR